MVGRICPRCQSFDVRAMTVQLKGTDRDAYVCHDCLCVFHDFDLGGDHPLSGSNVIHLPKRKPKHR